MKDENKKEVKKVVKKSTPKKATSTSKKTSAAKKDSAKKTVKKEVTTKASTKKVTPVKKVAEKKSATSKAVKKQTPKPSTVTKKSTSVKKVEKAPVVEEKVVVPEVKVEIPKEKEVITESKKEPKKEVESKSKWDKMILFICIIIIGIFVCMLPNFNSMVRNRKKADDHIEEEKIPVSYNCQMNRESNTSGYTMKQDATYIIADKKIVKASIKRVYSFQNIEYYKAWRAENGKSQNKNGQQETFGFDEPNLRITKTIEQNLSVMNPSDLDPNFPKTYENLLIYTKDQQCKAEYE